MLYTRIAPAGSSNIDNGRTMATSTSLVTQWMQWLRHTRFEPPSLAEQQADIARQERMKLLAQAADARWAAKPSALDAPDKQQPVQMLESRDWNTGVTQTNVDQEIREKAASQQPAEAEATPQAQQENEAPTLKKKKRMRAEPKDSPWKKAAPSNPGDQWQPDSWSPAPARRRE
ncbi:hypothetical protein BS50DRAFT_568924 [Corynespora cassiicola Philippines]|uniref:Uncharacterized protein n=1 Tax=Corynespora cassiicola Philippines TaxID=1448308 RepID=A0A2T2P7S5_CORCC|nr:hypothetical protein BS50DRAFT_568924 [Corynespora cassiicola Philippines]